MYHEIATLRARVHARRALAGRRMSDGSHQNSACLADSEYSLADRVSSIFFLLLLKSLEPDPVTGIKGDNDPIDALDISTAGELSLPLIRGFPAKKYKALLIFLGEPS